MVQSEPGIMKSLSCPDKAPKIANFLHLGSPATTWKRLSVATVVEAHALVESFRAKGLLAASSGTGTQVHLFARPDSANDVAQIDLGLATEEASGSWPPQHDTLQDELWAFMHLAVDEHLARVMVGQFEQHEEGFFMLPLCLPIANRGSREAFRVETFISGDAICVQVIIWLSDPPNSRKPPSDEVLRSNASFELNKIICADTRTSSQAAEPVLEVSVVPQSDSAAAGLGYAVEAEPVSEQPGECLLDDELFDRLGSLVGNRPIDPPQENIDELCEWLGDANSQQAERMRCWNYLGNKERRLVERSAQQKQHAELLTVADRYSSTRAKMQVCARPAVPLLGARAYGIPSGKAQQNALRKWFDRPPTQYSMSKAVELPAALRLKHPSDATQFSSQQPSPLKRAKVSSSTLISNAVAQLVVDQSLDCSMPLPQRRPTASVRASVLRTVQAVLDTEIGPTSVVQPTEVVPTPAHPMIASFGDGSVVVSPSVLASWERTRVQPCGRPKEASYYLLCPEIDFVKQAATEFLVELSGTFEAMCLGSLSVAGSGWLQLINGCEKQPENTAGLKCSESNWADAVGRLVKEMQQQQSLAVTVPTIVHVIGCKEEPEWTHRLGVLYQQCREAGLLEPAVQWIQLEHVVSLVHPIDLMKELAVAVYLKLCRVTAAPSTALIAPQDGIWCVERRQQTGLVCMLAAGQQAQRTVHCCYQYIAGGLQRPGCLVAVWCDCGGAKLQSFMGFGANFQTLIAKCWELGSEWLTGATGDWSVVVSCMGLDDESQVEAWRELLRSDGTAGHSLVFLGVELGPRSVAEISGCSPGSCAVVLQHPFGNNGADRICLVDSVDWLIRSHQSKLSAFVTHGNNSGNHQGYKIVLIGSWGASGEPTSSASDDLRQAIIQFNALSWLTASPLHLDRPGPLPIHCAAVERMVSEVDVLVGTKDCT